MDFIFNNIKFGHPKLYQHQFDFFENYIIPILLKKDKIDNIYITGDLFYNDKNATFNLINDVISIIRKLSFINIYLIKNNYFHNIIGDSVKKLDKIKYDINENISLFQLSKKDNNKVGFFIFNDKINFIENKFSPKFIDYEINKIDDIDKIEINNNFITLNINSDLLENQQYKNIIELYLNNNPNINCFYFKRYKNENNKIKSDIKNINIRDLLLNNIDNELKDDIINVFKIYDQKKNE